MLLYILIKVVKFGWKGGCGSEAEGLCLEEQQQLPLLLEQREGSRAADGAGLLTSLH